MTTNEELEQQIKEIQERNKRVELDKAWETGWMRRIIIFILTYGVILSFFLISKLPNPFANALVPALAFAVSTLTVDIAKRIWLKEKIQ